MEKGAKYPKASPPNSFRKSLEYLVESGKKFGTMEIDPPWQYNNKASRGAAENHYPTMSLEDIAALPIGEIAAKQSHLHIWVPVAFRGAAEHLIKSWGFDLKSERIWTKPQIGMGNYWRLAHEILLLGVRGGLTFPANGLSSWRVADRGRHSEKPAGFRHDIELVSPPPRIEIFARTIVPGWSAWGNEIVGADPSLPGLHLAKDARAHEDLRLKPRKPRGDGLMRWNAFGFEDWCA